MLKSQPPDNASGELPNRGLPTPFAASTRGDTRGAVPPGEDGVFSGNQLENVAARDAADAGITSDAKNETDFLSMVRTAEAQAQLYTSQVNRRAWSQSYRALHNEHFVGSKYTRPEYRGRSRLFVPKTRSAMRKDNAAAAASLFNNMNAISCQPGNEADARQRAGAAIMQELVNYRTDRATGKASFPWFFVSMGARQDAVATGICITKQYWKNEYRKVRQEEFHEENPDTLERVRKTRDVFALEIDRPDMALYPPENILVDSAAPWMEVAQKSAYFVLKNPMTVDEIMSKMEAPVNPWNYLAEETLRQAVNNTKQDQEAVRRAREMGLDRFDETQTGTEHQVIWVYETFIRHDGEDWTFWSLGTQHYLTDPKPTREIYPEQYGERPISYGYGSLESHRIFPMSPVESWQPLQVETNDLRNLMLDATKQNVMPISKVRRGRRIDMDQVKRRAAGSSIFVDEPDDVTWETPPAMPTQAFQMSQKLDIEMDDAAGQQNYGNVEQSNALGKTLGGLRLAAGAANAVQEFDLRVWIESWAQPALAQIVRLEQYYESDPIVLGLCGERAQLFEKHGMDKITDELLEQSVLVQIDVGLGAGDPQQRLMKFQSAASIAVPLMQASPEFQSGQVEMNWEEVFQEIFGAAGYRDGGMRFVKVNPGPRQNPMQDLKTQEIQAKIEKDKQSGKAAMLTGLANVAKVALGQKDLEAETVNMLLEHQQTAKQMGFEHGDRHATTHLSAIDHGHTHGLAIAEHRRGLTQDAHGRQMAEAEQQAGEDAGSEGAGSSPPAGASSSAGPNGSPPASSPPELEFVRHPQTNDITGVRFKGGGGGEQPRPKAKAEPEKKGSSEDRIARLEALIKELSKPRKRKVTRDGQGRVSGVEDVV